jgi:hypothetical protein
MNFNDLTGKVFGRYTVLSYVGRRRGHSVWLCKCSCGKEKVVDGQCMRAGTTKSCGCLRGELTRAMVGRNTKKYGEASFNGLYKNYKIRSRKTNKEFSLTAEEFKTLTSSDCKYCGSPPSQKFMGNATQNGAYVYNGIDRVDNAQGYNSVNAVPCCIVCNHAKHSMLLVDFLAWIERLIKFHTNSASDAASVGRT